MSSTPSPYTSCELISGVSRPVLPPPPPPPPVRSDAHTPQLTSPPPGRTDGLCLHYKLAGWVGTIITQFSSPYKALQSFCLISRHILVDPYINLQPGFVNGPFLAVLNLLNGCYEQEIMSVTSSTSAICIKIICKVRADVYSLVRTSALLTPGLLLATLSDLIILR